MLVVDSYDRSSHKPSNLLYTLLTHEAEHASIVTFLWYHFLLQWHNRLQNVNKTIVMDVIGFVCVSLNNSTVWLHNSVGSTCACSEAGFGSQTGNFAWGVYYWRHTFCCAFFCGQKYSMQRIFIKKCFVFMVGSVCFVKQFTTGSRNSQGHSKVTDDAQPGVSVEECDRATVQQVEESTWADRRITIDSVTTVLGCSHVLAYSIMHDHLKFRPTGKRGTASSW
jgi:hypothetical protein